MLSGHASADAALIGLARDVLADVVACQETLALAQVRGYVREEHGRLVRVRPFERRNVHRHAGLPGELPPDSLYALGEYKSTGFGWLNKYLRNGFLLPSQQGGPARVIPHLDRAFELARPTTHPVAVYRGARGFLPDKITPGAVLRDGAYISTTTDKSVAKAFLKYGVGKPWLIRITVPPGEHILSMENLAEEGLLPGHEDDAEHEILLPRNRSIEVTDVHGDVVEAVLLPAEQEVPEAAKPAAPAKTPAQLALEKAMAYKKSQVAASQLALSRQSDRSARFCWSPGDVHQAASPDSLERGGRPRGRPESAACCQCAASGRPVRPEPGHGGAVQPAWFHHRAAAPP